MKKGTKVSMELTDGGWIDGVTIENVCSSPTQSDPDREVVRVKWSDGSDPEETIESVTDLYPQS